MPASLLPANRVRKMKCAGECSAAQRNAPKPLYPVQASYRTLVSDENTPTPCRDVSQRANLGDRRRCGVSESSQARSRCRHVQWSCYDHTCPCQNSNALNHTHAGAHERALPAQVYGARNLVRYPEFGRGPHTQQLMRRTARAGAERRAPSSNCCVEETERLASSARVPTSRTASPTLRGLISSQSSTTGSR
jgi:hypothetical protein